MLPHVKNGLTSNEKLKLCWSQDTKEPFCVKEPSLEDTQQRRAEARVNSAEDKSSKTGTSPQKEQQPDDEQKELDGHNADERQYPRKETKSLQIKELSIHSHGGKTKSNKTSVFSKR